MPIAGFLGVSGAFTHTHFTYVEGQVSTDGVGAYPPYEIKVTRVNGTSTTIVDRLTMAVQGTDYGLMLR
jgi:hypothetical protein